MGRQSSPLRGRSDALVSGLSDRLVAMGGDLNRSMQHTVRTSLLAFDIARSWEAVRWVALR